MNLLRRSLVVGAFGQVGAQIVRALGPSHSIATSRQASVSGRTQLDLSSLTPESADAVLTSLKPDAVYCVGGMTDVERCESESGLAMRVNCEGPANLAAAAAARNLPFVYFSTEYVFNGMDGPYGEDAEPDPLNGYGMSKWRGEIAIREVHPRPLILRTTGVYGPDPGEKNFLYSMKRALLAGRSMRVACDQDSTPTYNLDLAANAVALVRSGASGVFHVCGPERLSRLQFARLAARRMGLNEAAIIGVPTCELGQRARRPLNAGLLTEKLRTVESHLPMHTLHEALHDWLGI